MDRQRLPTLFGRLNKLMKKYSKNFYLLIVLTILVIPKITFASWWNPASWRVWNIFKASKETQVEIIVPSPATPTIKINDKTETNTKANKLKEKKKKPVELAKKQETKKEEGTGETTSVLPLKPFVPPAGAITPPEVPTFYVQAPDGTMWQGFSKQEAQEKADQYMKRLDTKPPIVNIQKVTDSWLSNFSKDQTFKGVVGLHPIYEDPLPSSGMIKIEYYMDNILFGTLIGNLGGKIAWDTTKYSNGIHTLTEKAYDKAGNVGSGSVSVTVENNKEQ